MCSVTGAIAIPRLTSLVTISGVNGLAALGISALPGTVAYAVWYASSGHRPLTYP